MHGRRMTSNRIQLILAMIFIMVPARADIKHAIDYADFLYGPYHLNCISDSEWVKGSGRLIRTMLENILSRYSHKDGVFTAFERETRPIMAMSPDEIEDDSVEWITYGRNKHDGWLYGVFEDRDVMAGDDLYYLYSDFRTAIRGKFVKGKMLYGRKVKLTHFRCKNELLELHFTKPKDNDPMFYYEQPNETRLTLRPTLMDPIDRRNVYVASSTLGEETGEGLFAKRQFMEGELICLYAGALLLNGETWKLTFANMSLEAARARNKNVINLNKMEIDVAEDNIVKFRVSLGHKAQHSFIPNAKYCIMKSPRFGTHRCIEALKDIKKGEEIFANYEYTDLRSVGVSDWYRQLFIETFPERAHEAIVYDNV